MASTVSLKFRDATSSETTEVLHIPASFTPAQVIGWVDSAIEDLDDSIGAQIISIKMNLEYDLANMTLKAAPTAGSRISSGGVMTFETVDGAPYNVYIPALLDAHMVAKQLVVAGALAAFRTKMVDGVDVGGTQVIPSDRYDNTLTSFLRGKLGDRDKL